MQCEVGLAKKAVAVMTWPRLGIPNPGQVTTATTLTPPPSGSPTKKSRSRLQGQEDHPTDGASCLVLPAKEPGKMSLKPEKPDLKFRAKGFN